MPVFGIANNILSQISAFASHGKSQQVQQGFQVLGQDLQSGNLSQAQSDFASLQQLIPGAPQNFAVPSVSAAQNNPLATAVSQLAKDLQSGNLSAAQSDLSAVQQDAQQVGQQQGAGHMHHHHHHQGGDANQSSANANDMSALFGELGQSLQAGNLSAAQQAYASLQQDFQLFNNSASVAGSPISLSA